MPQPTLPEDGYHLSEDLADQAIKMILDAHARRPRSRSSCTTPPARRMPRTTSRRSGPTATRGSSTTAGTPTARRCSPVSRRSACSPPTPSCRRTTPTSPSGTRCRRDERRLYARMMEVFAGFVSHADHHFGRILDTLERIGELDNTLIMIISDNGASAEGGAIGSFNEMLFFNRSPRRSRRTWPGSTNWAAPVLQPLPVGLDVGRQHAVPPLEARDLPRRRDRPVHPGLAGRDRPPAARSAASTPTPSTWCPPCSTRSASSRRRPSGECPSHRSKGVSFAHTFDDADAPTDHTTQYFEMFGHRSIYHDGWRAVCPWPGPNFTEAARPGRKLGDPITPEVLEQLDRDGWELYHIAEDPTESHNVAAEHPTGSASWSTLWWDEAEKYKVLPLDGSMQPRLAAERPQTSQAPQPLRLLPARRGGPGVRRAADLQPAIVRRGRRRDPAGGDEGVLVAQGGDAGGYASTWTTADCGTSTTTCGRDQFEVASPDPIPVGPAPLRYEFEPTGAPDITRRQGIAGPRPAVRRRHARRQHRLPAHHAAAVRARGTELRLRLRRPRRRRLRAALHLHRHDPQRHLRPLRRPDHGRGRRDRPADGPAVIPTHPTRPMEE